MHKSLPLAGLVAEERGEMAVNGFGLLSSSVLLHMNTSSTITMEQGLRSSKEIPSKKTHSQNQKALESSSTKNISNNTSNGFSTFPDFTSFSHYRTVLGRHSSNSHASRGFRKKHMSKREKKEEKISPNMRTQRNERPKASIELGDGVLNLRVRRKMITGSGLKEEKYQSSRNGRDRNATIVTRGVVKNPRASEDGQEIPINNYSSWKEVPPVYKEFEAEYALPFENLLSGSRIKAANSIIPEASENEISFYTLDKEANKRIFQGRMPVKESSTQPYMHLKNDTKLVLRVPRDSKLEEEAPASISKDNKAQKTIEEDHLGEESNSEANRISEVVEEDDDKDDVTHRLPRDSMTGEVSATQPYIDGATPEQVTAYKGVTAIIPCFVNNLGQRSVSTDNPCSIFAFYTEFLSL